MHIQGFGIVYMVQMRLRESQQTINEYITKY